MKIMYLAQTPNRRFVAFVLALICPKNHVNQICDEEVMPKILRTVQLNPKIQKIRENDGFELFFWAIFELVTES